jgi:hypothetical protein
VGKNAKCRLNQQKAARSIAATVFQNTGNPGSNFFSFSLTLTLLSGFYPEIFSRQGIFLPLPAGKSILQGLIKNHEQSDLPFFPDSRQKRITPGDMV